MQETSFKSISDGKDLATCLLQLVPAVTASDYVIAFRFKKIIEHLVTFAETNILDAAAKAIDLHGRQYQSWFIILAAEGLAALPEKLYMTYGHDQCGIRRQILEFVKTVEEMNFGLQDNSEFLAACTVIRTRFAPYCIPF